MIRNIPGQAVSLRHFGTPDFNERNKECTNTGQEDFCQPVSAEMLTQFQVLLDKKTGIQLVTNPNFQIDLTGWTISGEVVHSLDFNGSAFFDPTPGFSATLLQSVTVTSGAYYYLEAKVRDIVQLSSNIGGFVAVTGVPYTGNPSIENNKDRIVKMWFFASGTTANIQATINAQMNLEYVKLFELSTPVSYVRECGEVADIFQNDVRIFEDRAIISVDWSKVTDKTLCYNVCVFPDGDLGANLLECKNGINDSDVLLLTDNLGECITSSN